MKHLEWLTVPGCRLALLTGLAMAPIVSAQAEILIGGRIITPTLRLGEQVSPKVSLYIRGDSKSVGFIWADPNGRLTFFQTFYLSRPAGQTLFEGTTSPSANNAFPRYAMPGNWTLVQVGICDKTCTTYSGATLAALFPSLSLTVINPEADNVPPNVTAGMILTPTVRAARRSVFKVALTLSDDHSGVAYATVTFAGASNFNVDCKLSHFVTAPERYELLTIAKENKLPPGVYTANSVVLTDAAGNQQRISDPNAITSLFAGKPNITITN